MSSHLTVPSQLGRYRLTRLLGRGGMGSVYLADDAALGREVALKVPHIEGSLSSDTIERFQREARMAARLLHPNLCPVFDVGCIDGIPYFTMPFIAGTPLSHLMPGGSPWPLQQAARLVAQLAGALQVLHAHGIIHRDLKPGNVLIRPDGEPMLMDFGLARSYWHESHKVTQSGQLVGTPAYMSPEQILGQSATLGPATDIYSLGVLLYQLIAGRLPFEGPAVALFGQALHADPPPPSQARPDRDTQLDVLCRRAMARDPNHRFATMSGFQTALHAFVNGSTPALEVPPVDTPLGSTSPTGDDITPSLATLGDVQARPRRLKPVLAMLLAVVVLGVGAGAAWVLEHQDPLPTGAATATHSAAPPGRGQIGSAWREVKQPPRIGSAWSQKAGTGKVGEQAWVSRTNSIGMELVRIPADGGAKPLWVGQYEVTVGQFRKFVADTGIKTEAEKPAPVGQSKGWGWSESKPKGVPTGKFRLYNEARFFWDNVEWPKPYKQTDQHPVMNITWDEAKSFCDWLSGLGDGWTYDLPTETEWEYACRAGARTRFSWGNDIIHPKTGKPGGNIADVSFAAEPWFTPIAQFADRSDDFPFTAPVGRFPPNAWGLYDMHGNLSEYCGNRVGTEYPHRGGSFQFPPDEATCSSRHLIVPNYGWTTGFRVVVREK